MLRRTLLSSAALAGLGVSTTVLAAPAVGQKAPAFSLPDTAGKTVALSSFRGRHVVLEWVNPGCPYVRKHYGSANMQGTQKEVTAAGVVWLAINSGHPGAQGDYSPDQVKSWQKRTGSTATAYFRDQDGTVGRLYGAKTTPHMYVISADGTLVYNGAIDSIRSAN